MKRKLRIYRGSAQLLRKNLRTLLGFSFLYKTITTAVFYPLFIKGIDLLLRSEGYSYITFSDFIALMKRPFPAIAMMVLAVLFSLFVLYEYLCMAYCFEMSRKDEKISLPEMFFGGLHYIGRVIRPYSFLLSGLVFLGNLLLELPVVFVLLSSSSMPAQIKNFIEVRAWAFPTFLVAVIPFFLLLICAMFVLPFLIIERKSLFTSLKAAFSLLRKRSFLFLGKYIFGYAVAILVMIALYFCILFLAGLIMKGVCPPNTQVAVFLASMQFINPIVAFLYSCVLPPLALSVLFSIFYQYREEVPRTTKIKRLGYIREKKRRSAKNIPETEPLSMLQEAVNSWKRYPIKREWSKRIFAVVLLGAFVLNILNWLSPIWSGFSSKIEFLRTTEVSAHRGSELRAPENTLAAIVAAHEDLADFAEIDVQMTKDEVLVLLHDDTLRRTAGVYRKISDMTYEEVKELEVGSWFSEDFAGEKIPTLDEVMEFASGRLKLNIDVKLNERPELMAQKIAELLEKYNFYEYCVVSSFHLQVLKEMKKADERIQTGLILTFVFGQYTSLDYVDFFSMHAQFITPGFVEDMHRRGFAVHAWSADSPRTIRRLLDSGVDNLITVNPLMAKEMIFAYRANPGILQLAKFIFGSEQLQAYEMTESVKTPRA